MAKKPFKDNTFRIPYSQHKNADFKDIDAEKGFIGAVLNNEEAFGDLINNFDSGVLTNIRLKRIYDKLAELYMKDGVFVNDVSLIEILDITRDRKKLYKSLFNKIKVLGVKNHTEAYITAEKVNLERLYSGRIIEIGMREILRSLSKANDGDYTSISKASEIIGVVHDMSKARNATSVHVEPVKNVDKWLKDFNHKQKYPQKYRGIPTGIAPIDKRITGLRESEFGLGIAGTGVGKSIFLLDCGVHCWRKYGSVAMFTIEMPAGQMQDRLWCNLTGIDYEKFRKLLLTREDKRKIKTAARRLEKSDHKFRIIDMPEGCTVDALVSELEPVIRNDNTKLVCIDYMNIIACPSGEVSLEWQMQVEIAMALKQKIARKFKIPTWSVCQTTGDRVAFSQHIKDNIDIGIGFVENEDTDITEIIDVDYPKARDFKGTPHKLKTDRGRMTMCAVEGREDQNVRVGGAIT